MSHQMSTFSFEKYSDSSFRLTFSRKFPEESRTMISTFSGSFSVTPCCMPSIILKPL
jgi:hypothetical protein